MHLNSIHTHLWRLAVVPLLACGRSPPETTAAAETDTAETGAAETDEAETDAEETGGGQPVECAPEALDFWLQSWLSTCTDATCVELSGSWHGLETYATDVDLTLTAQCTVAGSTALEEGTTRWILANCVGDQIPDDGMLALDWVPAQPYPLPLFIGQPLELRYRALYGHSSYIFHHGWSIRDDEGTVLAFHSARNYMPDPWLTEPIVLTSSHQDCTPTTICGGTTYRDQVEFHGAGEAITLADGNAGEFVSGETVYDAFVFEARSGSGYNCGVSSEDSSYNLAFVAR